MTIVERALCALGLHSWLRVESGYRLTAVCARNPAHRRLLELTPLQALGWYNRRPYEQLLDEQPGDPQLRDAELNDALLRDEDEEISEFVRGFESLARAHGEQEKEPDAIALPEAEIESAAVTIPEDIPAPPEPLNVGVGRTGRPSRVVCAEGYKLHKWGSPDADGWMRCLRGCGAGRSPADAAKRVWPADQVPPLAGEVPPAPQAAVEADEGPADEEIIYRPETPAGLRKEPESAAAVKPYSTFTDEDFGDFGEQASDSTVEADAESEPEIEEDLDDDTGVVRPRPGAAVIRPEQLTPLAGRGETARKLIQRAPCPKCGTGQLQHDPLEPRDSKATACLACGYRRPLSAEQSEALRRELVDSRGHAPFRREQNL